MLIYSEGELPAFLLLSLSLSPLLSLLLLVCLSLALIRKGKCTNTQNFWIGKKKGKTLPGEAVMTGVCSWSLWGWVCPEADILGRWNELLTKVRSIIYGQWRKAADGFCILETGAHLSITEEYAAIRQELPIFPFQLKSQSLPLLSWKDIFPIFQSVPVSPPVSGNLCLKLSPWLWCSN